MPYTITADYQRQDYIACHTKYTTPFKNQIDIGGIGFRRDNGAHPVIVFPSAGAATAWGTRWFKRNKRVMPSLNSSFFSLNEVTIEAVE